MRDTGPFDSVQDYTNAFLGMSYPILTITLVIVWGVWGYPAALAISAALHWGIGRLAQRRAARDAAWEARVAAAIARGRR